MSYMASPVRAPRCMEPSKQLLTTRMIIRALRPRASGHCVPSQNACAKPWVPGCYATMEKNS